MKKRTCLDCEFYGWEHQNFFDEMYCRKKRWIIYGEPEDGIPGWCPIELAKKHEKKLKRQQNAEISRICDCAKGERG